MDPERAIGVVRSTSPNLARMMEGRLGCPFPNLIIPTLSDFTLPYISSSVRVRHPAYQTQLGYPSLNLKSIGVEEEEHLYQP